MTRASSQALPLVSIMMPVYNGEQTMQLALRSLLAQTFPNWICIVVNDGSTDRTQEILESFEKDPRFRIIQLSKNQGRGNARQVALDHAKGDFLAYLDVDDFYHPRKLELQVKCLMKNPDVDLVACGIGAFDDHKELKTVRGKGDNSKKIQPLHQHVSGFFPASAMIRLDRARQLSYRQQLNVAEDVDYFRRYLAGRNYMVLSEVLYFYFEFGSTTSGKILSYYRQAMKSKFLLMQDQFLLGFRELIKSLVKYAIYLIFLPLLGVDFFLKRRGAQPGESDFKEYERVFTKLTTEHARD